MSFFDLLHNSSLAPSFLYKSVIVHKSHQTYENIDQPLTMSTNQIIKLIKENIIEHCIENIHVDRFLHYQVQFLFHALPCYPTPGSSVKKYFFFQLPKVCPPLFELELLKERIKNIKAEYILAKAKYKHYKLEMPKEIRLIIFGAPAILERMYPSFAHTMSTEVSNRAQYNRAAWSAVSNFCSKHTEDVSGILGLFAFTFLTNVYFLGLLRGYLRL